MVSRMRMVALMGLAVPILAVILACSGTEAATTTQGNGTPGATTAPKQAAKIGDTITIDGIATTLVSVKKITPGEFDTPPKSGDAYYALHVKITNKGSSPADFNEFEFKALTGDGSTIDQSIVLAEPSNATLSSGQIAPGGSVSGDLVFELGTKDTKAELVWQPGLDNSLDHVWNLGLH